MNISDTELDRLFRAANPAPRTTDDSGLTAAEIAIREGIIRGDYRPQRRRRRPALVWAGVVTATAAVAAATVVAVSVLVPTQPAVALTPPALHYTAAGTAAEVFADAERTLMVDAAVAQAPVVHSVSWNWSVDLADEHVEVVPQEITLEWGPGQPTVSTIVAGEPYWPDGERPDGIAASPYAPGELIDTVALSPEEFALPTAVAGLSGSSRAELDAALGAFGATSASSSGELLAAITGLLQYWTLTDAQHAALLELLDEAGGVTVRGETTDRLGRDVIGVQVSLVVPERVETAFISVESGRIVGVESELVAPLEGLPAGVVSYTMWDAAR
ncbi:hypothetical protein [Microbacterium sufflavum]|uniref:Uncharacterized protein n=1 Tax=Microbacterium sufflavum TaxID=2851649 RepID=A0ABY4ICW9_9MICO|nr:hypothetical protein [Microbacterium sufflavum]UPL10591.1 hypothetical protein KV394_05510 [Microbacterium sufflavum]